MCQDKERKDPVEMLGGSLMESKSQWGHFEEKTIGGEASFLLRGRQRGGNKKDVLVENYYLQ